MLTQEQWQKIDDKYGKLMYTISHRISGDAATASFDDNLQDIRMAAMEAVIGFTKQNDGVNGSFDEFFETRGFDKYIKTCMWSKKNNKGAKITKKSNLLTGTVSTEKEEVLDIAEGVGNPDVPIFFQEIDYDLNEYQKQIVALVIKDPTIIKPCGKLNVKILSENIGLSWYETDKQIKSLGFIIKNHL